MLWFKKNLPLKAAPPINSQFDQGCYTLLLSRLVDEHTNAEALWQKKFTAYPKICEKNTQNENYRLQAALEKNPAAIHCYDEKLKRTRPENFIYSDVVVWLPQAVIDKALRQNTGALNALSINLPVLHQDRFNAQLLHKRQPHYALHGSDVLQNEECAFQFGFGIYVAAPQERPLLQIDAIYTDAEGQQHPFSPQVTYQTDSMTADNHIYPEQQTVLISNPSLHLCLRGTDALWFSSLCSHIQLQRRKEQWQAFASTDSAGSIRITTQQHGSDWYFECNDTILLSENGQTPRLLLIIKPIGQPYSTFRPVDLAEKSPVQPVKTSPHNAQPTWGATVIPDFHYGQGYKTIIPTGEPEPLLIVEGLALPRIDTPQSRVQGLKQWTIWFDEQGNIVDGNNPANRSHYAAVSANQQQPLAYFKNSGKAFAPISFEQPLFLAGRSLVVLPSPSPERFHALLKLLNPMQFILQTAQPYTIGRKSETNLPEIDLTLLNDPRGMEWETGSSHAGSMLSMLSLSRNHLSFSLENEQLQLRVPANKQPVYLLNEKLALQQTLQSTEHDSTAIVMPNHYLLLGCFLLRFSV